MREVREVDSSSLRHDEDVSCSKERGTVTGHDPDDNHAYMGPVQEEERFSRKRICLYICFNIIGSRRPRDRVYIQAKYHHSGCDSEVETALVKFVKA